MRCILVASLLAGLAVQVYAREHGISHDSPIRRRKTLGFGPEHPHAVFHSSPYQIQTNSFLPLPADTDPLIVAQHFVADILGDSLSESSTFRIREDSYTDSNTGVTHVYVRQVVNGYDVVDGDMNVNIKDGVVLSYGNSFYKGPTPQVLDILDQDTSRHPHREYCQNLDAELDSRVQLLLQQPSEQDGQIAMGGHRDFSDETLASIADLQSTACRHVDTPYSTAHLSSGMDDVQAALLQFMIAATPSTKTEVDILNNFDHYKSRMGLSRVDTFTSSEDSLTLFIDNVPDTVNPVKAKPAYIQTVSKDGQSTVLEFVWKFEVEMEDNWYEAAVSAMVPHRIISVVDWASDSPIPTPSSPDLATYNVFAWGINDPSEGNRSIEKENYDILASPVGWHTLPFDNDPSFKGVKPAGEFYRNTTTTWGNNVFAHENWEGENAWVNNYRPDAGAEKSFDFKYAPKVTEKVDALDEAKKYINATVTQLFYTSNMVHDLYYRYGFDEVSGNFQQHNFGRGGKENDAVIANAQDGSGYNNANFMTPPDGQNGRCRMYLWNTAIPYRDGDLEAGIVIHELSHGLSTRLTGGPANSGCLGWGESGGMGEGWGDFLATTIRSTKNYSDYPMGAWAANTPSGIRNYPYSLNDTINPSTYKTLDKPGYWGVHAIGEVWAEILWGVSQKLIADHGFSDNLFPPAPLENGTVPVGDFYRPAEFTAAGKRKPLIPKNGNTLAVQLVLNGMKLQQCRPSFFDARDAIIQADQVLTNGENYCTLWKGFAERGLGPKARVDGKTPWGGGVRTNDFVAPEQCLA